MLLGLAPHGLHHQGPDARALAQSFFGLIVLIAVEAELFPSRLGVVVGVLADFQMVTLRVAYLRLNYVIRLALVPKILGQTHFQQSARAARPSPLPRRQ